MKKMFFNGSFPFLKIFIIVSMVGANLLVDTSCYAAFTLTAEPFGGGFDVRFGHVATSNTKQVREVTIRVTSDIGKQYRVYQRIERPLRTGDGTEINSEQFKMFTLINSNTQGTLERMEEYPVMFNDTVLYTSNAAGDSDSFKVAYTFTPQPNQVPGSYFGRILYVLLPIDSVQEQVIAPINMYVDLSNEGSVELSTTTGTNRISFSTKDIERKIKDPYPQVKISVKGNLGARYRIYQKLQNAQLKSESGEDFDLSKVTFETTEVSSGKLINKGDASSLRTKTEIYESDEAGSGADLLINYEPAGDFVQQKAGFYTGSIAYYLETDRTSTYVEPGLIGEIDLECEIDPVFRIVAVSVSKDGELAQEGGALLEFGDIGYKAGKKESIVRIRVESNLEKPFLVTQKFNSPLENEKGDNIPQDLFKFEMKKTELTKGTIKIGEVAEVEPSADIPIFISNSKGESDEFDIIYKLGVTADTRAGAYAAQVSYSLSEL